MCVSSWKVILLYVFQRNFLKKSNDCIYSFLWIWHLLEILKKYFSIAFTTIFSEGSELCIYNYSNAVVAFLLSK